MSHHATGEITNPGPFQAPPLLKNALLGMAVVGLLVTVLAFVMDAHRAWGGFITNHFYFLCLGLSGLFFAAIQWLTSAMWSAPVRRIAESFTSYLPFALLTTIVLFVGIHHIYHWSHADAVAHDVILQGKAGYLNTPFFIIRSLVAFAIWIFFTWKLVGNSLAQDSTKAYALTAENKKWAPIFLILFAISFTVVSFDQIMSLDPHWFSTMFGVYCFAGLFYSNLALLALLTIYMRRNGMLKDIVNDNHVHDIGKFMFAFTVFWAYIGFSQFMLIWYANLPEETMYFMHRFKGAWGAVSIFLLLGKFVLPFFVLLPRDAKRSEGRLIFAGIWMLFAHWIDVIWMVQPEFFKSGPVIGWVEIGMFIGFAGVFGTLVLRFLGRNNVVAIGDPRLAEAVFHHHQ